MFIVTCASACVFVCVRSFTFLYRYQNNLNEEQIKTKVTKMLEYTSFFCFHSFHMQQPVYFICIHIFLYGYAEHAFVQYLMASITQSAEWVCVGKCLGGCVLWCIKWESVHKHIWAFKLIFNGKRLKWIRNDSLFVLEYANLKTNISSASAKGLKTQNKNDEMKWATKDQKTKENKA